jgi:hypothetical protein
MQAVLPLPNLPLARKLDGRLVCLGARVAEKHAVRKRRLHQRFRQRRARLRQVQVAHVAQLARLLRHGSLPARVAVAECVHSDASRKVQVCLVCGGAGVDLSTQT